MYQNSEYMKQTWFDVVNQKNKAESGNISFGATVYDSFSTEKLSM